MFTLNAWTGFGLFLMFFGFLTLSRDSSAGFVMVASGGALIAYGLKRPGVEKDDDDAS
jgi:hypothetical protein